MPSAGVETTVPATPPIFSLPPELLRQILSETAPLPPAWSKSNSRFHLYCLTSLVSSAFLHPSQELLWTALECTDDQAALRIAAEGERNGRKYRTKTLRIDYRNLSATTVERLFGALRGLEMLEVAGDVLPGRVSRTFDTRLLSHRGLVDLRQLTLTMVEPSPIPHNRLPLFFLTHLSLTPISKRYSSLLALLLSNPSTLSTLTHLSLNFHYGVPPELALLSLSLPRLTTNLHTLSMPAAFAPMVPFLESCHALETLVTGTFAPPMSSALSLAEVLSALPGALTTLTIGYHCSDDLESEEVVATILKEVGHRVLGRLRLLRFCWFQRGEMVKLQSGPRLLAVCEERQIVIEWDYRDRGF